MKKRYLAILSATLLATGIATNVSLNVAQAQSVAAFKTAQGEVVVTGLKPGRLYGVTANTGAGYGVSNITATACGEVIISKAAGFKQITINRQKIAPSSLPVKTYSKCTKSLPPAPKPR
jgi:hypothetical protein